MNDYIWLNNQLFSYINRQYTKQTIGSKGERTLSAKNSRDIIARKSKFTFTFELDYRQYLLMESIFNLNSSFTLIDWNGTSSYTVSVSNDFSPQFNGSTYDITLELEEE
jgi:hypothetical protein